MGADGYEWVQWGAGATGGHKNKTNRDENGRSDPDCDPMAGEISPDIMFRKTKAKVIRTTPHGGKWICMDVVRHICSGGQEKMAKRGKIRDQDMFCRSDRRQQKQQVVGKGGQGGGSGCLVEMMTDQRVSAMYLCINKKINDTY